MKNIRDFTDMTVSEKREWLRSLTGERHDLKPHPLSWDEITDRVMPVVSSIATIIAVGLIVFFLFAQVIR